MAVLPQQHGNEVFAALVTVAVASFLLIYVYAEARRRKHLPPGPWPWPVVGNFPALGDLPHQSLKKLGAKYGGLMYLRLGSQPCIVITTADVAKEFYRTNDAKFMSRPKRMAWTVWHDGHDDYRLVGFTSNLQYWRRLRRLYNTEVFSPGRHASQRGLRAEEIQHMMKVLVQECKNGDAVDLKAWLYGVTSNTMTRIIIGKRYFNTSKPGSEKDREDLVKMNTTHFDMFGAQVISDYVPYLSFVTWLQGHAAKFAEIRDFSTNLTHRIFDLDKHRRNYKEHRDDPSYVPDFEDVLLQTPLDDGEYLPDKYMHKILQELLNAGTETSATLVEWAMAELVTNPTLIKRAQAELDKVVPEDRLVTEADLPNLPYLQAIIKEAFRMHPPAPLLLPHVSNQVTEFLGYTFPAGTMLYMNAFAIHRDPSVYKSPDVFDPERFVDSEIDQLSANEYYELIPFGAGKRMCPAYNLANSITSLMLANLIRGFEWSLPVGSNGLDMTEVHGLTVTLKVPLSLVAKPRLEIP